MIKYRTGWNTEIERVEVEKETAAFVFIKRGGGKLRREAKRSEWTSYFDSFEEARSYLIERIEAKIRVVQNELADLHIELQQVEDMTEKHDGN